jgi:hypothetical protein
MTRTPTPGDEAPRAPAVEPGAGVVVWGTWALAVALTLGLVARFGAPVPRWDDFDVLPVATGAAPLGLSWLFSPHNEHRVVLPRLVLVGLARLVGPDARAGMVLGTLALGAAAAWLLRALARRPGGPRVVDAIIPLVLLSPGQHENLLWSYQVTFTLGTALLALILGVAIGGDAAGPLRPRAGVLVGLGAALSALCGANGLAIVPAVVAWLLLAAAREARRDRRRAALLALAALPAAALVAGFVLTAPRAAAPGGGPPALADVGRTLVQFAAIGLGPAVAPAWRPVGALVLMANLAAAVGLAAIARRRPGERPAATGVLALLLGALVLAVAVAWGRAGAGPRAGLEARYVTIALPLVVVPLVAARRFLDAAVARAVLSVALMGVCLLSWPNATAALAAGRANAEGFAALDRDLARGLTETQLLRRYVPFLHPSQEALAPMLPLLRRSGLGRMAALRRDPAYREVALGPRADRARLARPDGDAYAVTGIDPWLDFRLPARTDVAGVRLRYDHEGPSGGPAHFVLAWRRDDQPGLSPDRRVAVWTLPTGRDREVTLWVHDRLDELSLQPDNAPCRFRIRSLTLLVP